MSVDKEKKPAKAAAKPKKAAAPTTETKSEPKAAAAPKKATATKKAAAPKAKAAVQSAVAAGIPEVVAKSGPTHQDIAYRAYFYYVERNGEHGQHESDWLRAERDLLGL